MLTRLRHRAHGQEGFTLIELLVVILIIGILAAVAIPAFLNQKGKAQDANVKSDISTAQTAEETYNTNNAVGGYVAAATGATASNLTSIENALTPAFQQRCHPGGPDRRRSRYRSVRRFGDRLGRRQRGLHDHRQ